MERNGYKVGSLLWIERNRYNLVRAILDALIANEITIEESKTLLFAFDTDSVSY